MFTKRIFNLCKLQFVSKYVQFAYKLRLSVEKHFSLTITPHRRTANHITRHQNQAFHTEISTNHGSRKYPLPPSVLGFFLSICQSSLPYLLPSMIYFL